MENEIEKLRRELDLVRQMLAEVLEVAANSEASSWVPACVKSCRAAQKYLDAVKEVEKTSDQQIG